MDDSLYEGALTYDKSLERKRRKNQSVGKSSTYREILVDKWMWEKEPRCQEIDQDKKYKIEGKAKKDKELEWKRIDVENTTNEKEEKHRLQEEEEKINAQE